MEFAETSWKKWSIITPPSQIRKGRNKTSAKTYLLEKANAGQIFIVLDCSKVTGADTSIITALVAVRTRLMELSGEIVIIESSFLLDLLQLSGVKALFRTFKSLSAFQTFSGAAVS